MMKRIAFALIFLSILSFMIVALSNPLRKSEDGIRADLLKLIPLDTEMQEAISIVKGKDKWTIDWVDEEDGIVVGPYGPGTVLVLNNEKRIGEKSMLVYLGYYYKYCFIQTDVSAFFAFDENSKLIEIAILKSMNVL